LFSLSSHLWELLFLEGGHKTGMAPSTPPPPSTVYHFRFSPFLLTWQRDNPSRFTSSEFTFTTSRTTDLILRSYKRVWYSSCKSGLNSFLELRWVIRWTAVILYHIVNILMAFLFVQWLAKGWTTEGLGFDSQQQQDFSTFDSFQTSSGVHPASCPIGTGGSSWEGKASGTRSWQFSFNQCRREENVDVYVHSPIRLHGVVLN
jgi:hypothetical protein